MRVLVIGGHGQIGSKLPDDWEKLPKNKKDTYDLTLAIEMRNPDIVINCACVRGEKSEWYPYEAMYSNVAVPIEIARACEKLEINMVHFSTFYVGNGVYYDTKAAVDMLFRNLKNVSTIYLPTLFDKDHIPRLFPETFHCLYTKDLIDWLVQNIDLMRETPIEAFLCNDGEPSRKEFLDFIGEFKEPEERKVMAYEDFEQEDLIKLRHWKEAAKECYFGNDN